MILIKITFYTEELQDMDLGNKIAILIRSYKMSSETLNSF